MIKNYFLLFFRNLKRQKLFTFINILGLTISMASTLLIFLYVQNELSYDRFHKNAGRIYRVNQTFIWGEGNDNQFASTGPGVAYAVREELPEVEVVTSIHTPGNFLISYTNEAKELISFDQENILAVDSNFFKMFNFPMVKGNPETALIQAQTMVMTESTAKKYFGSVNPVGKLVRVGEGDKQQSYEITGVVKDAPTNSYIQFDVLMSMNSFPIIKKMNWSWVWTQLETFILLDNRANIEDTRAKLALIPRKHAEFTLRRVMNMSYDEYVKSGKKWELFLQPLTSIHLPSGTVYNRLNDVGNIKIVYSLAGAGLFIILLSCVNFMNLSTAQFTRRVKEASIRKIMGLGRRELSLGYFVEALIFCFIALLLGLALTELLLPGFNLITGKSLGIHLFNNPSLSIALVCLVAAMSLLSGSYPAIFLSAFNPAEAVKGKIKIGSQGKSFRNALVVFQFGVSIVLLICTAVVFQQLNYFSEKNLGFDKENLLVLNHVERVNDRESLANSAKNLPGVLNVSWCSSVPPRLWGGDKFTAEDMPDKPFPLNFTTADENYISTLGIKMRFGRNFQANTPADQDRVILNETAVKRIGWDLNESVIGKKLEYQGAKFEVIGVVQDFNFWSLQAPIESMGIFNVKTMNLSGIGNKEFLVLKVAGQRSEAWAATLSQLHKLWKEKAGDSPYGYEFVDQTFAETFKSQQQFGNMLTVTAVLAIIIAGLGLLGMIIYTLEQRTKEIGIRKVSGASTWNILVLISQGYTRLILIAFIVAAPLSYWIMLQWLQDFPFRITPSPFIYVGVGMGTLLTAIIITSYHSVKAALTNPVEVLRDE